jgi:hypothetical protein
METTVSIENEDTPMVMTALLNTIKRVSWYFASKKHVVITYTNGDIDIFPTADSTEIDDFLQFLQDNDNAALAILLGGRVKLINFLLVRSVEVVEGIMNEIKE